MSDHQEQPKGERPLLLPPVWALIFFVAIYFVGQSMPGRLPIGVIQQGLAFLVAASGFGIAAWALIQFQQQKTTYHPTVPGAATSLVTDGVYKITRNPMYVGMALVLAGEALYFGTILGALLVMVFVGVITAVQIIPEERALARLFGAEFEAFKYRTPRWLLF